MSGRGRGREGKESVKWKNESLQATRQKAATDLDMETDSVHYCYLSHCTSYHIVQPFVLQPFVLRWIRLC